MKNKKLPMRRCVGCMESKPKNDLIRIASNENQVTIDLSGKANGRGVYLCKDKECFEKAKKRKAIQRGLETEMDEDVVNSLFKELSDYEGKNK